MKMYLHDSSTSEALASLLPLSAASCLNATSAGGDKIEQHETIKSQQERDELLKIQQQREKEVFKIQQEIEAMEDA